MGILTPKTFRSLQADLPELAAEIPGHGALPWHTAFGKPVPHIYCYAGAGGQGTPIHFDGLENLVRHLRYRTLGLYMLYLVRCLYGIARMRGCLLNARVLYNSNIKYTK